MSTSASPITRRTFLANGSVLLSAVAALSPAARAQTNKNSRLRIFQIGVGGIGQLERNGLKNHPNVEWAGFADVDARELAKMRTQFPQAWGEKDYRQAFANRLGDFDAVIVETPDFHHAPMMVTALKHNKHLYGQKPLVQQLDELRIIREALAARPSLVTQMGNQRACIKGRMQAVEILRKNQLGRPIEAWVWTGSVKKGTYFADPWSEYSPAQPVPADLDWDLWKGPLEREIPYSDDIAPRRWRAFWETGGGQLADWGCHLIDALYFAYDLPSPESVMTHTPKAAGTGHSAHNISTITYPGGGRFAREKFVLHYNDDALLPSFASLGLPAIKPGANQTLVICEEGALLLEANGGLSIFRKGQKSENEPLPEVEPHDHWKDWADNCLGAKKHLWTPLTIGWRITEPCLLAVKASRFPGEDLRWDTKTCRFTQHESANKTIVARQYRQGFEPPTLG
jgi:predicted dehydrogenase